MHDASDTEADVAGAGAQRPAGSPGVPARAAPRLSVSGAVLAGGSSRRMRRDKRHLDIDGVPLLVRAVASVAAVCDEVVIVTSSHADRDASSALVDDRRWIIDERPGEGPLAGIEAALLNAPGDAVMVVAGDHPEVVPAVLRLLVDLLAARPDADAAMLGTDRGPQPLVAVYRTRTLATIRPLLDTGERRARSLLDHLEVVTVDHATWRGVDPDGRSAIDLDTPEDVAALRHGDGQDDRRRVTVHIDALVDGVVEQRDDQVVVEEPLEILAAGPGQEPIALLTTLRTPGNDDALAVGWLYSEGLVEVGDVVDIRAGDPLVMARPDDRRTVVLHRPLDPELVVHRHAVATASCGVCGRATIGELLARCQPVADTGRQLPWSMLAALPGRLRSVQPVFAATGGLHAAAIVRPDGSIATLCEDVGRHNALDAAVGSHVLAGDVPLTDHIVVLSGRAGFELVAKAAVAGAAVVAAAGAPTDLSVRTAQRLGLTLIAFLRDGRGNIYTHPQRIRTDR